jgi:NAD(P) transhydrogenase subunit alpha
MKIAVLRQREKFEKRVAIYPDVVKLLVTLGIEICIESGAGIESGVSDREFLAAGAKVSRIPLGILADADIILKVQITDSNKDFSELEFIPKGATIIGLLSGSQNNKYIKKIANKHINCFAMELMPRISRAQAMDVLSSQSNLAGYRAVIDSAYHHGKAFPMMMTAAGTVLPINVLVIGAGIAGLQATATAKRLGAIVSAFDIRAQAKEQVESLGARFIQVEDQDFSQQNTVYATKITASNQKKQSELLAKHIAINDIIISTALIEGKTAPILITEDMLAGMKQGSVIYDLAAVGGGNCSLTKADQEINYNGVKIIGYTNIPSRIANEASKLYSKNLYHFLKLIMSEDNSSLNFNLEDEIIKATLVIKDGKIIDKNQGEKNGK